MSPPVSAQDAVAGLDRLSCTHGNKTRDVYEIGEGPAVVVIHEMPGLTPSVIDFGRRVADAGMTAVMPDLFGEVGRAPSAPYIARQLAWGCVAKEFTCLALESTAPVTQWLRALAADAHERCGGPGVGAVGMCFTGGFALAMMVDDTIVAPVLSQPAVPFPISAKRRRDVGLSSADLARVKERVAEGACVLGLRFSNDLSVPAERFERLAAELGDGFLAVEIDSSKGNEHGIRRGAHSVLTEDLVDEAEHPTRLALEQVLEFFRERLGVAP